MPTYTNDDLISAVKRVLDGEHAPTISTETGIPYRTLAKWVVEGRKGVFRAPQRRGPAPTLTLEAEQCLFEWVVGRQLVGCPATRQEIIYKAGHISALTTGQTVGEGWYRRFMERHPALAARTSEAVSKARNSVTKEDTRQLFNSLLKVIIEHKLDPSRVFNVDETAFETSKGCKRVIAVRGSQNVWHPNIGLSFHMTIVACGNAAGYVVPPLFVLPGATVKLSVLDGCNVQGAAVTTTSSGFMNTRLFIKWLCFFSASVPAPVKRPLLLVLDGCSSHYSLDVVEAAERLGVLLLLLPANATHLLQPLDVAVFSSMKARLRRLSEIYVGDTGSHSINKQDAVKMACDAWRTCSFEQNIVSGFRGCGLYPLSKPKMDESVSAFLRNGAPREMKAAAWLQIKDIVQKDVLVLPPPSKRARKTVTVNGRLLTREVLLETSKAQKNKAKPKPKPRKQLVTEVTEVVL